MTLGIRIPPLLISVWPRWLLMLLVMGSCVLPTLAHARLTRSRPENKAELATPPATVELWFNELLENSFNTIEVFPAAELKQAAHANLATEKPRLDPKDRTHIILPLPVLAPGEYVVQWRVLSRDGHSAPGRLTFRVAPKKP
jgi:methionine-rich copper-binding protein CopC